MSNQVQFPVFNFNSSAVRVIIDPNQEPWFCGADVCRILGYVNESLTLQKHCKENGVSKRYLTDKMQRQQEAIFINEPNLYRLIIKSRKPEAEKFEAWVFEEVLPQIRKTGKYALQNSQKNLPLAPVEKTYTAEMTAQDIHSLVWLFFSHAQMNGLLGHLIKPLEAIGSRYAPSVYGNHTEYKRHLKECQPILHHLLEQIKQDKPKEFEQLLHRLTA